MAQAAVQWIREQTRLFPHIRPLCIILKRLLFERGLNETYTGGIGSFLLFLMVLSFLQLHLPVGNADFRDVGSLLLHFLDFWSRKWNYLNSAISWRIDPQHGVQAVITTKVCVSRCHYLSPYSCVNEQ